MTNRLTDLGLAPDMTTDQILVRILYAHDESRNRSLQTEPGASEIFGCRRKSFMRAEGFPEVNVTRKLAAIKGTAFHHHIEAAIRWADPDGDRFLTEVTVPGIPGMGDGHVDLIDLQRKLAADWKTTLKKSLRYFPKPQQRAQVQVYGDLLVRAGFDIETVQIVAIPLDGQEEDIRVHTEARNAAEAERAYAWLLELDDMRTSGEFPPADLSGVICEEYCPFFGPDSCSGKTV